MHDIDTADADRRETFLQRVAAFIAAFMVWLFGQTRELIHAVADGMKPELAKRRYEAREADERADAIDALTQPGPAPERAAEPAQTKGAPSVGALVQRHARHVVHDARELEAHELGDLGVGLQGWLYGLTHAECRLLLAVREGLVTMHALGRGVVPGVVSVAAGTEAAKRRLDEHLKRRDLEMAAIRPGYR